MKAMQAYCFKCEKTVTALLLLNGYDLLRDLDKDSDIEVIHASNGGDHRWKLSGLEKQNLRVAVANGLL